MGWTRVLVAALALRCLTAGAAESLIDPRVTLDVADQPLSDVLAQLEGRTGVPFDSPFRQNRERREGAPNQQPDPGLDRLNPKVSLKVTDEPLRAVLAKLSAAANVTFRARGFQPGYMVFPAPPAGAERPTIEVGGYRLKLTTVRQERVRERRWWPRPETVARDLMHVLLGLESPTALAEMAFQGIGGAAVAKVDGQTFEPVDERGEPTQMFRVRPGFEGDQMLDLTFKLPQRDGRELAELSGELVLSDPAEEVLFEYDELAVKDQLLSDQDCDVTLVSWRKAEPGRGERDGQRGRGRDEPAWSAELRISRPVSAELARRLPGEGRGERPGNPPAPEPPRPRPEARAEGGQPAAEVQVAVMVQAGPGQPVQVQVGNGPIQVQMGPGDGPMRAFGGRGMGGGMEALLPTVALDGPDGRRVLGRLAGLREVKLEEGRATFNLTVAFPEPGGDPARLIVALALLGEGTKRLPFRFEGIKLVE